MFSKCDTNTTEFRAVLINPTGNSSVSERNRSLVNGTAQDNEPASVAPATVSYTHLTLPTTPYV